MNSREITIDQSITKKALTSSTALTGIRHARLNDKLQDYLNVGLFMHTAWQYFESPTKYGQFIAQELPETKHWDAPLRSSCLWLYRALNVPGSDGYGDLLDVLEVESLAELKTANPSVIKRKYKIAKGEWDYAPKRKQARKAPSKPKQSPAPLVPRHMLETWQILKGKSYEANLCLPII
ncbi:hypothetical protein [Ruegeria arenilitoris]|uniref:hypothetical protein n=1 Tax=Ruegeria arenilitoris TaxID=1173585 RepID=UPI00147C03C9|nr:hypothetical protein [Ruegeria arenilitoris]